MSNCITAHVGETPKMQLVRGTISHGKFRVATLSCAVSRYLENAPTGNVTQTHRSQIFSLDSGSARDDVFSAGGQYRPQISGLLLICTSIAGRFAFT